MSGGNAGQWVKFFNTAGIPSPSAATYAHIFVENRIQTNMLMDLNKEYLREMGITIMGDIIAILRHAKNVEEQQARERVLSSESKVPVATVQANQSSSSSSSSSHKISLKPKVSSFVVPTSKKSESVPVTQQRAVRHTLQDEDDDDIYPAKVPFEVMTSRTKEVTNKPMLYADREAHKPHIFDRLSAQEVEKITIDKHLPSSSSIFSRLGGKSDNAMPQVHVTGILKSTKKGLTGVTKKTIQGTQKVILVKKIPAKAVLCDDDDDDDMPEKMDTGEKTVSFSSEDEVVEIAPRKVLLKPKGKQNINQIRSQFAGIDKLRKTKKVAIMKATSAKKSSPIKSPEIALRMKSDFMMYKKPIPIQSRLDLTRKSSTKQSNQQQKGNTSVTRLTNRIGKVSLSTMQKKSDQQQHKSVFDRLGFNNKKN